MVLLMTETAQKQPQNVIKVTKDQLPACCPPKDQEHWNQHPRVYLEISRSESASCPYCGNKFVLEMD